MRSFLRSLVYHSIRLFRLRSSTDRIARGFAIGMMVHFFPTFGFGILVAAFLARLLGGNLIAGLIGGSLLGFAWPLLFYLNVKVGSFFWDAPFILHDVTEVNDRTMRALMWGTTFTIGALINSVITGLVSYFLMLALYKKVQPHALQWLRRHVPAHEAD